MTVPSLRVERQRRFWQRPLVLVPVVASLLVGVKVASLTAHMLAFAPSANAADAAAPDETKDESALKSADDSVLIEKTAPSTVLDPAMMTEAELELLRDLSKQRDQMSGRSKDLDLRERLLEATERRIDGKIAELKALEQEVKGLLVDYETQENERLSSLVRVYEKMKPADAARILERLDMSIQLDVAARMSELRMAPIMSKMTPPAAQELTTALATHQALSIQKSVN